VPFWDDDGQAYLVHSKVGAGPLILHRMSEDGRRVLDGGKEIVRDPANLPTLEGPKFYKRHGYYYIFAPFGGVEKGSQAVLRAGSVWGPYEHRIVLTQGSTNINGPHQGAYVETAEGRGWFVHFQSRGAHGRIVHLQPVQWRDDWPIIGKPAANGDGGEPVAEYPELPTGAGSDAETARPQTSDEFNLPELGVQWEWNHNPDDSRWSLRERPGFLRLMPGTAASFLEARNTLTQQMQDESLEFTVRMDTSQMRDTVHAGLAMLDKFPSGLQVVQQGGKRTLQFFHRDAVTDGPELRQGAVLLRVSITGDRAACSYSIDGRSYQTLGAEVPIAFSFWKGSRPALFAYKTSAAGQGGFVDFDWAHYRSLSTTTSE